MENWFGFIPSKYQNEVACLAIIAVTILTNYLLRRGFNRFITRRAVDLKSDITNYKFLGNALTAIIYGVGILFAIRQFPSLQALAGGLLTGAGILAAVVGLASQQAFSNIVSGIFLVIFKPFRVNDRLKIKETFHGIVEDITLRHTVIRDFENRRIVVPNSVIANEIIVNSDFNDDPICKFVEIGVAYNTNIDRAKAIMVEEIAAHKHYLDRRTDEQKEKGDAIAVVRLIRMTDWAMILRGDAWAETPAKAFVLYCDLLESIKKRFDAEGIEIPYPHYVWVQGKAE